MPTNGQMTTTQAISVSTTALMTAVRPEASGPPSIGRCAALRRVAWLVTHRR